MFIPVNAKADIQGSKKGKLTPAQNAVVNAMTLEKQTGIFVIGNKCEALASSPSYDEVTVTFDSGYFAVCGRLVEVEKGSAVKVSLPASGKVEGNIVARFNLGQSGEEEFKVFATDQLLVQEDLNTVSTGVYDFSLYEYEATPSGVTLKPRKDSIYIYPSHKRVNDLREDVMDGTTVVKTARDYASGGTIDTKLTSLEQRVTNLGFKTGSSGMSGATLRTQGKCGILSILQGAPYTGGTFTMSVISAENFSVSVPAYNQGSAVVEHVATFSFSAGSNKYTVGGAYSGDKFRGSRIGFEIR